MIKIPEPEWRKIRDMKAAVLDRACKGILNDLAGALQTTDDTLNHHNHHKQYLHVYKMLQNRDNEIAQGFNDLKRSNAYFLLAHWVGNRWITLAEFNTLSEDTRGKVLLLCGLDDYDPSEI
ncbi:MAG: hypothetical protein SD837_15085 [Candidatus Electrothrix scaldis]|nr:MAG: hypothetical protein SD837_15085 [Candidatus Electrothrix sp. GW3-3]